MNKLENRKRIGKELGSGNFGSVHKGKLGLTDVAIKMLKTKKGDDDNEGY